MEGQSSLRAEKQAEPKLLYHYTSLAGLVGILESRELWASGIRCLNDASEFHAGMNAAFHIYNEELLQTGSDSTISKHTPLLLQNGDSVFVASFSAEKTGDDLSQWRAYSGDYSGVSLGLAPRYLSTIGRHFLDTHKGEEWYETAVDPLVECRYFQNVDALNIDQEILNAVKSIADREGSSSKAAEFARYAATLKHRAFYQEREWRIALIWQGETVPKLLKFRRSKSMLIPYICIPLDWSGQAIEIDRIVVGPSPHQHEAEQSIKMLLNRYGVKNREIVQSSVPYRNW
jgi:Protein of unknown function (DUF2971)